MKKFLFTLLSLLCCTTVAWAGEGDGSDGLNLPVNADGYIEVRTADELVRAIKADNSAKIRLEADSIYVGGIGQICDTFEGAIVGGHMVYDPEAGERKIVPHFLVGQRGKNKGADSPLFNKLEGAHFENVAFMNFRVEVNDNSNDNLGVVATDATLTTFKNVTTVGVSVYCNNNNAGSIVGVAKNCTFEMVRAIASDVTVDGRYVGGIVGYSMFCNFNSCATNEYTHVFADGLVGSGAYAGGISGHSVNDHFYDCANLGWVGGDEDQVGGIVGYSMGSDFVVCLNQGIVLQASEKNFVKAIEDALEKVVNYQEDNAWYHAALLTGAAVLVVGALVAVAVGTAGLGFGLVIGILSGSLVGWLSTWVAGISTAMTLTGHDELGGIAGHAEGGYFEQCANKGLYNAVDEECGGIVGWGSSLTINNCYSLREPGGIKNIKDVDKATTNASIIGYAKKCIITNNFAIGAYRAIGKVVDMSAASGNNYYVCDSTTYMDGEKEKEIETSEYEMRATTEQMMSGQLAYWLNNLHPNEEPARWFNVLHPDKELALRPWRQNLTNKVDSVPMFDLTHNEVTVADITTVTHITDAEGLAAYAQRVNKGEQFACAVLDDDITLSGNWTPIGHNEGGKHFRGIFDGQGHTISGLKVEMANDNDGAGLFGAVHNNAIIRDVIVDNTSVVTNSKGGGAAGIVGLAYTHWMWSDMVIKNCASYASVNANKHAGGILGRVMTGDNNGPSVNVHVNNCYSMGTITAENGNSGLLCGYMKNHGHVTNSWSGGQLRNGQNKGIWPYSIENDDDHTVAECLVGYDQKFDVKDCYIINPEVNVDQYKAYKDQYPLQAGVEIITDDAARSGELAYRLNKGVTDGTQMWYQKIDTDPCPVRTKLTDGTNMVYGIADSEGNIVDYANTSHQEISQVILGNESFEAYPVADINKSGDVDVIDLTEFTAAANR